MGFPEIAFQAIQLGAGKRGERETYTREGSVDWWLAGMECRLELIITGYKSTPFTSPLHSRGRLAGKRKQHGQVKL